MYPSVVHHSHHNHHHYLFRENRLRDVNVLSLEWYTITPFPARFYLIASPPTRLRRLLLLLLLLVIVVVVISCRSQYVMV